MLTLLESGPELANVCMYFCAIEQKYNCATKMSTLYKYFNQSQNNWPSQVMTQREFLEHCKKNQIKMPRIIRKFLKMIFMQPSYHRNLSSCKFRGTSYLKTPQLRFLEYFTIICLTHVKLCFKLVTSVRCLSNFLQSITFLCHSCLYISIKMVWMQ